MWLTYDCRLCVVAHQDGTITKEELKRILHDEGEESISKYIEEYDLDKDGRINYEVRHTHAQRERESGCLHAGESVVAHSVLLWVGSFAGVYSHAGAPGH